MALLSPPPKKSDSRAKKHDPEFPRNAVNYCLSECGLSLQEVDKIVFHDKPLVKFERLLKTYFAYAPLGLRSFLMSMPIWLKEKLFLKTVLKKQFQELGNLQEAQLPMLMFTEHQCGTDGAATERRFSGSIRDQ